MKEKSKAEMKQNHLKDPGRRRYQGNQSHPLCYLITLHFAHLHILNHPNHCLGLLHILDQDQCLLEHILHLQSQCLPQNLRIVEEKNYI